jgi:hypothetical protein
VRRTMRRRRGSEEAYAQEYNATIDKTPRSTPRDEPEVIDVVEVPIRTLRAGDGFRLVLETTGRSRPGYVVEVNDVSATVMLLDKVERVIETREGSKIPIASVVGLQHWGANTLVVPDGTRHEVKANVKINKVPKVQAVDVKSEAPAEQAEEETVMPKTKKSKKAKKERKPRAAATLLEIDAAKARAFEEGRYVKENGDGKLDASAAGFIVRTMLADKKKIAVNDLAAAIVKEGFEFTSKRNPPRIDSAVEKLVKAKILSRVAAS